MTDITRIPRSTSMPSKAVNKIPQRCHFYRRNKRCKWGDFCKYQHALYVPKPIPQWIPNPLFTNLPNLEHPTFNSHKAKLEQLRDNLRK